jgi:hypothetical protein
MGMFGTKMGSWETHSKTDSRWNKNGRGLGLCCAGGPQEMKDWVNRCKTMFGEAPADLVWSFMKD